MYSTLWRFIVFLKTAINFQPLGAVMGVCSGEACPIASIISCKSNASLRTRKS